MSKLLSFILVYPICLLANANTYICETTDDITTALENAQAGDQIIIKPGTYISTRLFNGAYFFSSASGTAKNPITLKGLENQTLPSLKGNDIAIGTVLRITGSHWVLSNLEISTGLKGVVFDNTLNNKIVNCSIHKIGNEAIHIRDNSDYTIIDGCNIYDTGNLNPGFGEGIYVGTDKNSWNTYNYSCDNTLIQNCEIGPNVRAESIDVKEGTSNTVIKKNTFNGLGMSGKNSSTSFVSVKGTNTEILNNVFNANNNTLLENGINIVYRGVKLSGYQNYIHHNIFYMDVMTGFMVNAKAGTSHVYAWDNVRLPKGKNYSKNITDSKPIKTETTANKAGEIVYQDNFDTDNIRFSGSALKSINVSTSKVGELKLEMKPEATLPKYSPIMYRFPTSIDFSKNIKLVVRVKSKESFKIRFDLHDGKKATNGKNGRVTKVIPAGIDAWTDLEFIYPEQAFKDNDVNKNAIKRINVQLDPGKENFPNALYFEYLKVVNEEKPTRPKKVIANSKPAHKTDKKLLKFDKSKKYVILKMDDLRANTRLTYNESWQKFINKVREYRINAGLGIVATDLQKASQSYKDSLVSWHQSSNFEIWHHGWDHKRKNNPPNYNNEGEFSGTPYDFQKKHFDDAMSYAKNELGISMKTFGAPYNKTDETFTKVIEENEDIKVWLYGKEPYKGMVLKRGKKNLLESAVGVVSYDSFLTAYEMSKTPYVVLQGHPGKWDDQSFNEFDNVVKFLKKQNVVFILPYDYYLITHNNL